MFLYCPNVRPYVGMGMMGEGRGAFHLVEVKVELLGVFVITGHLLRGLRWWVWWVDSGL